MARVYTLGFCIKAAAGILCSVFFSVLAHGQADSALTNWKFDFGNGLVKAGYIQVKAGDLYHSAKGYGFVSAGKMISRDYALADALLSDYVTSDNPFYFHVNLPEGQYEVRITFGDPRDETVSTVKAESRRLMIEKIHTQPGEFKTDTFLVDIRTPVIRENDSIRLKPRERAYLNWDGRLTLEFNNERPCVNAVEIIKRKHALTVFLAGNSTVTDQEYEPWASWGQMIPEFFNSNVVVANYAESGETLKAFQAEKRLDKILSLMKPGDYLFIEFGHNDQKPGAAHVQPYTGYQDELWHFINETRKRGGIPVLVTPIHRRRFDKQGGIVNTLDEYPASMRQLARHEDTPLIDLNAMSKTLFEALGPEGSKKAFVHYPAGSFPGQDEELADDSHFSNYGAYQLARCVVEGIIQADLDLKQYLKSPGPYDPANPDPFDEFSLPHSPSLSAGRPAGN